MPGGRPPRLLEPGLFEELIRHIQNGNYVDDACLAVGIGERTFYTWIEFANRDLANGLRDTVYVKFMQALKEAHAKATVSLMEDINNTVDREQQWTNKAWILERTRNRKFGQRQVIELETDSITANLDIPTQQAAPMPLAGWLSEHKQIADATPADGTDLEGIEDADVTEISDLEEIDVKLDEQS